MAWIALVIVAFVLFLAFVVRAIVLSRRIGQQTGREAMVGEVAVARTPLDPGGTVFTHGELWQAVLDQGRAEPGEEVLVTKVEGLKLRVTKKKEGGKG
ncbi:MAG: serine protease [Chloroflexi bacterium]|jgi:membrane-bound serine protease (ClpP class)|nr:serine protease [Chloroflexota bacterium]